MTRFNELPDSIECVKLKEYFIEFLICYCNSTDAFDIYYILNELLELSDRQWHTYELLDQEIKQQLERYLKSIIDFEDEEIMDYILCIIPRLGLENLFEYILKNKINIHNENVMANINEAESEYGGEVNNPYAGM